MRTSKEDLRLKELIKTICKELNIDKSVALHFINSDLERISNSRFPIDNMKLSLLENEIKKHIKSENELKLEIENKDTVIKNTLIEIDKLSFSIKEKTELLTTYQQKSLELQTKLNHLNSELKDNDKKNKLLEYSIMMKNHAVKKINDNSYKYLSLFLAFITILSIIIVTFLIYKK